mmetsp:Transcript_24644/g.73167  ORF Transcript_24644/g.73167 Transcript_24644/m.73167 type:complete len:203 (+) Transcript_24644:1086-1694(+)
MSSRSSTSRKMTRSGTIRRSCRLITATWSWPVPQMWLRKRWYLSPRAMDTCGRALVALSRRSSSLPRSTMLRTVSAERPSARTAMAAKQRTAMFSSDSKTSTDTTGSVSPVSTAALAIATENCSCRYMNVDPMSSTMMTSCAAHERNWITSALYGTRSIWLMRKSTLTTSATASRRKAADSGMASTKPVSSSRRTSSSHSHQ